MSGSCMKRLEEELLCPICLSVFVEPVQLPCMHNFCRGCISSWARRRAGAVRCPECNRGYERTPPLERNLKLTKFVERFKLLKEASAEPQCVLCGQAALPLPVRKVCLRCKEPCCQVHVQRHLQQPCAAPGHLLVDAEELSAWTCPIHNEYKQFYCEDEQEALCTFCFVALCPADGHKVSYVEQQRVHMQDTLRRQQDRLVDHVNDIDVQLTALKANKTQMKDTVSELELRVRAQYQRMHRLLEVNQAETMQGLESTYSEYERNHTQKVQQLVERRQETEKYLDSVQTFIKDTDNINFMKDTEPYHMLMDSFHLIGAVPLLGLDRLNPDHLLSVLSRKEKKLKRVLGKPLIEAPILETHQSRLSSAVSLIGSSPGRQTRQCSAFLGSETENSPPSLKRFLPDQSHHSPHVVHPG